MNEREVHNISSDVKDFYEVMKTERLFEQSFYSRIPHLCWPFLAIHFLLFFRLNDSKLVPIDIDIR